MPDAPERSRPRCIPRRQVVVGGLCAGALAAARRPVFAADAFRFGLTPVFLDNDLQVQDRLKSYLEATTRQPVELVTRRTYQEVTALLVSGQLDAAWICGYPYIQFKDDLELVAVPEWRGKPLYKSYLIVGADRAAGGIRDLRGDIHAFSDPDSNSGYLVTRAWMHSQGLDPATFFRRTLFTYGHRNVIRAVAANLAQSGSVDGYVWEVMRELEPELIRHTRVLHRSDWLGFPPIATSRKYAGTDRISRLRTALLGMSGSEQGREVLTMLRLTGFTEAEPALFDGIARLVDQVEGVL